MDWIKRNLMFVISAVVALALLGGAGWYCYSGWSNNAAKKEAITAAYGELNELYRAKPAPGDGKKVDNIKLAREQQKEAQEFLKGLGAYLREIPAIPAKTGVTGPRYSAALQETISLLQREATNNSVIVPPAYKFSFSKQASLVTFAPGTLDALAVQLGEVKAICDILNDAKINSLDGIRRERVTGNPDDLQAPATDYFDKTSVTNDLAVASFYEVTFQCFTPELAAVLSDFARSPYGLIVKAINVEPAATTLLADAPPMYGLPPMGVPGQPAPGYNPYAQRRGAEDPRMAGRYAAPGGLTPRYAAPPQAVPVQPQPYAVAPARPGLTAFLTEKQLKVTMLVEVIKLLPASM